MGWYVVVGIRPLCLVMGVEESQKQAMGWEEGLN
jgi:hypothetical protein